MSGFAIRFLLCNIFLAVIIVFILTVKRLLRNHLTNRMQYHIWFVMLLLFAVPYLPMKPIGFPSFFTWFQNFPALTARYTDAALQVSSERSTNRPLDWIQDFSISVSQNTPSVIERSLLIIWITGIIFMLLCTLKSRLRLQRLKQSALPLQNPEVRRLYHQCLHTMQLNKDIPLYCTAFLKSPIMVGVIHPAIYLPTYLISDYNAADMRYMLLHELQHYAHKDNLMNWFMNLSAILYWFHPFVRIALKEMLNDREIACDTSVLLMLDENEYENYGHTLINFAEKISITPIPFSTGIAENVKQIKQRISNIASYKKPSTRRIAIGWIAFIFISLLLFGLSPSLSTYAAKDDWYLWQTANTNIASVDFSAYFDDYNGSFVLYDTAQDSFKIYNMENAKKRIAPNSTYKIYDALWGLESGVITSENSKILWNTTSYPYDEWNMDQDLNSAMRHSVNWYFQSLDDKIGPEMIQNYLRKIQYGNQDINGDLSSYWMESTLKISPIEQVELLRKLYQNDFNFSKDHIQAVKEALHLQKVTGGDLYGKTGTGQMDGKDVNGWFVGYIEISDHTYFFSTNIRAKSDANGSAASAITISILSDLRILK